MNVFDGDDDDGNTDDDDGDGDVPDASGTPAGSEKRPGT